MNDTAPSSSFYTVYISLIVALGGFLMGFDASVISGVVKFIEVEFTLSKIELGWSVASLTLTATLAMMVSGPLSDKFGRKKILMLAAVLFSVSAVASALASSFVMLVIARMIGGLGVGAALIIAPMYIAEMAPAHIRGRLVSLNQLNIVVGISAAFFSNYLILSLANSDANWVETLRLAEWNWRWMLGLELVPALAYFLLLFGVPESPRWLVMRGRDQEAMEVLTRVNGDTEARHQANLIRDSLQSGSSQGAVEKLSLRGLFAKKMRLVMFIGISIAILQQITGINAVFFYAPMIFEQAGFTTDAAFMQAVLVGLTNLVFTLVAIALIDKLGRKALLGFGVSGVAICMLLLAWGFSQATYTLTAEAASTVSESLDVEALAPVLGITYENELAFKAAITDILGDEQSAEFASALTAAAMTIQQQLILFGILGFVACFAVSLGPVMWVLFSELFPNAVRGLAISFVGLVNSGVSFGVQLVFPWELANLGAATTFLLFGLFAIVGLVIILRYLPETKGKSLEQLEMDLCRE